MKGFLVMLSDEHREKLETIRRQRGDRSMSDSVRWLIESFGSGVYIKPLADAHFAKRPRGAPAQATRLLEYDDSDTCEATVRAVLTSMRDLPASSDKGEPDGIMNILAAYRHRWRRLLNRLGFRP